MKNPARKTRSLEPEPRQEPRTGVVRKVHGAARDADGNAAARRSSRAGERESGVVTKARRELSSSKPPSEKPRAWRCLDWSEQLEKKEPAPPRARIEPLPVSIAQLSLDGTLLRQSGPDGWLPEAGDFVHRMSLLVAQGLGFDRCCGTTLRGRKAVFAVSEAGANRVVAISGPTRAMSKVLSKAGLS